MCVVVAWTVSFISADNRFKADSANESNDGAGLSQSDVALSALSFRMAIAHLTRWH